MAAQEAKRIREGTEKLFSILGVDLKGQSNIFKAFSSLSSETSTNNVSMNLFKYLFRFYDKNGDGKLERSEIDFITADYKALTGLADVNQFTKDSYTMEEFVAELMSGSDFPPETTEKLQAWKEPEDDSYIATLTSGAQAVAAEFKPVFDLFGVKPDFSNFIATVFQLASLCQGEQSEKFFMDCFMKYMFLRYDVDGNGELDRDEMTKVVRDTLALVEPELAENEAIILLATEQLFKETDTNSDGLISLEEFLAKFAPPSQ